MAIEEELEANRSRATSVSRDEVDLLVRVGQTLVAQLDLEALIQEVTDAATDLTGAQFGSFFFNAVSRDGDAFQLYTLSGAPKEAFASYPMPRSTHIFRPTFEGAAILRLDDVTADPRYARNPPYNGTPPGHLPVRSYLAVPVVSPRGKVHGGLFFGHADVAVFDHRAERLAVGIAAFAAVAIDNAILYEERHDAVRSRDAFLAAAAHDLRTPAAAIVMRTELVKRKVAAGRTQPAFLEKNLAQIGTAALTLVRRIEWLTDLARVHAGGRLPLHRAWVDVRELVRAVAQDHLLLAERHPISVRAGRREVQAFIDADRIRRVVENLLTNAVKYSPEGGPIVVTVSDATSDGTDWVVISVTDQGIGIPANDLPRLFDPFHRGRNVPSQISGSGIGLATAHAIVKEHSGHIAVESSEGEGSTFAVWLPRDAPPEEPTRAD